jgi:hypothetical protein
MVVLDSQSVLVSSDVLLPVEGSVSSHSVLDLESDSVTKWIRWELWSSWLDVVGPGLVEAVVA